MLKGNLKIWKKQKWNIDKWLFEKIMSLTFQIKRLRNLQADGIKTWLV